MKSHAQPGPEKRPRSLRRRLLALAMGFVVALVLAEIVLAIVWQRPVYTVGTELNGSGLFVDDPVCGWAMASSFDVVHELPWGGEVDITTNSRGFRDIEHDAKDSRPRVVVLGDSFTFGFGVELEETFARGLARALPELQVHNFGSSGFNTAQEHAQLKAHGLQLRPRVVVVALCMNDVVVQSVPDGKPKAPQADKPTGVKGWLSRNSSVYELTRTFIAGNKPLSRLFVTLGLKESLPGFAALDPSIRPYLREPHPTVGAAWRSTLDELAAIRDTCTATGAALVVAIVPPHQSVDPAALTATLSYVDFEPSDFDFARAHERLSPFCRERGIALVDPAADFRARIADGEVLYLPGDMHFNAAGHTRFTAALLPAVRAALE